VNLFDPQGGFTLPIKLEKDSDQGLFYIEVKGF
jgi:hypothetical protein